VQPAPHLSPTRKWPWRLLALVGAVTLGTLICVRAYATYLSGKLVRSSQAQILGDPTLLGFAKRRGPAVYARHCDSCHGAALEGDRRRGVPDLADKVWLYGEGSIDDIQTTILYGIRSGHPKSRNLTDMPAFGRNGLLTQQDVSDVVEYALRISKQPHDAVAAERGREIFLGRGMCYDCHASDGEGVADYGTPALTGRGGSWLYGGSREALLKSVYDGRHGLCPAWIGTLSFVEIRELSVYVYEASRHG
jgi:cytochrome c oxidase cbb3-type subunit 3